MKLSDNLDMAAASASTHAQSRLLQEFAEQARYLEANRRTVWDDVRDCHEKFGTEAPDTPTMPYNGDTDSLIKQRKKLLREEFKELMDALDARDLAAIAAECVDVIYVAAGTMVAFGLPLLPFWNAIHMANMAKQPDPNGGKWIKPMGWIAARPRRILHSIKQNLK